TVAKDFYFRTSASAGLDTTPLTIKASGNLGIGTTIPAASALMDISSTTQGFLPPRMTTTQKNAISSPATGLTVYDTTLGNFSIYNGTTWASSGGGSIAGASDVTLTSIANGQLLQYDGTSSKWKNVNPGTAMGTTTVATNWPDAISCSGTSGSVIMVNGW